MTENLTGPAMASPFTVLWHPDADAEREAARPKSEQDAIVNAAHKLEALGPALGFPHSSAVQGSELEGLRELRPRRGRSRWRPLYIQVNQATFVILAVAPEAQINKRAFASATRLCITRRAEVEDD